MLGAMLSGITVLTSGTVSSRGVMKDGSATETNELSWPSWSRFSAETPALRRNWVASPVSASPP
eukprot:7919980-Pyramimonas_sp.AAC.1